MFHFLHAPTVFPACRPLSQILDTCWLRNLPENLHRHPSVYSLAQLAPHFQHRIQFKLHVFHQQFQLTSLRDTNLPKEVFLATVFFSITDSYFRPVNFYCSQFQNSKLVWNPLSTIIWLWRSGLFPCIPRRTLIRGFAVLLVFKSEGNTSLHIQLNNPKKHSYFPLHCQVLHI